MIELTYLFGRVSIGSCKGRFNTRVLTNITKLQSALLSSSRLNTNSEFVELLI